MRWIIEGRLCPSLHSSLEDVCFLDQKLSLDIINRMVGLILLLIVKNGMDGGGE